MTGRRLANEKTVDLSTFCGEKRYTPPQLVSSLFLKGRKRKEDHHSEICV